MQLDGLQMRVQFPAQLVNGDAPLGGGPFGAEFPILVQDPAGQSDQNRRGYQNGGEKQEDLALVAGDVHRNNC